ncbi:MAG: LysR family transcriptional regulator [Rhodospirillaceae bacterium]
MELHHIRYFLAVAEELNFTRAAEKLGIGQPPLSQQIRSLEKEIGATLFHRIPQGVELTEAGRVFLDKVYGVPREVHDAKCAAQRAARGELGLLRIGFTGSAAFHPRVPKLIRDFRRHFPEVEVALVEENTVQLVTMLGSEDIDAAFIRPGLHELQGLRLLRFRDEPMVIALPSVHPLAERENIQLSEMNGEPFVLLPRGAEFCLSEEVVTRCRESGFKPRLVQEGPQMASVINLVAAEMGVSIVPRSLTQLQVKGVVYVPLAGTYPVARMALAVRRNERSETAQNFITLVREYIRSFRLDSSLEED